MTKDVWAMGQIQMARAMLEAKKRIGELEAEVTGLRAIFNEVFNLLVASRNSGGDEELVQEAIDMAATASLTAEERRG